MVSVIMNVLKALNVSFTRSNIYKLFAVGLISLFTCAAAYYYYESPVNPDLSVGDAIWWGLVTSATVGYGDYYPTTLGGRLAATILMLVGISSYGFITAAVTSIFVENRLRKGMGLMNVKFEKHVVVIGWGNKSRIIIEELIQESPKLKIIIIDTIERIDLIYDNTYFVRGDPTKDETLRKANIEKASTVMVTADENIIDSGMADAKSVLICLAVDKMNSETHLIAEVLNEENVAHFYRTNVDDIIISNQVSGRIMVRSALYKNVSGTLKELLTAAYGNEIYECKIKDADIGMSFKDLCCRYMEEKDAIILGIANDRLMINPEKCRLTMKDDVIIYIARHRIG
ncbi:MAG: TrkA family potassium uptake protein [Clostridia bacterium]